MASSFIAAIALAAVALTSASGATMTGNGPPGGKYRDCHGYMRHVSLQNIRVHCIDGVPADLSFLSWPKFTDLPNGKTVQTASLKPGTPVHVIFTFSLGIRHAYKIYVANPKGRGLFGFKA
ncbi:MAG TPA: hypothetical protein VGR69_09020 [Candidatus Rubrimentiphilum sp.]|nr:hypothetical protein [Candidatus Rubrimentiphilum sp.]